MKCTSTSYYLYYQVIYLRWSQGIGSVHAYDEVSRKHLTQKRCSSSEVWINNAVILIGTLSYDSVCGGSNSHFRHVTRHLTLRHVTRRIFNWSTRNNQEMSAVSYFLISFLLQKRRLPLHSAIMNGSSNVIIDLIRNGSLVDTIDSVRLHAIFCYYDVTSFHDVRSWKQKRHCARYQS